MSTPSKSGWVHGNRKNYKSTVKTRNTAENLSSNDSGKRVPDKDPLATSESEAMMQDFMLNQDDETAQLESQFGSKRKHHPLPPCEECKFKCVEQIAEDQRLIINRSFWNLESWKHRRSFFTSHVHKKEIKRRTAGNSSKRLNSFYYYLSNDKGISVRICRTFFLTTLGFKKNNASALRYTLDKMDPVTLEPPPENRGTTRNRSSLEAREAAIREHVESYQPHVSHFRRELAPECRYLSNEITIKEMVEDFVKKKPEYKLNTIYEVYRIVLKSMNISFAKLGHEECDICEIFDLHDPLHGKNNPSPSCDTCNDWILHIVRAEEACKLYQSHCEKSGSESETAFYSADLQKVIMLPRIPAFKSIQSTCRLIAFNECFIPLRSNKETNRPLAILWNENVAGRKEEELVSAFHNFFLFCRDKKDIVIWLDNCPSQSKNWCFLTFLIYIVNSTEVETQTISLHFFESGHTRMSANTFHDHVEESMRIEKNIYDFSDFESAVREASSRIVVKSMTPSDFSDWRDYASYEKLETMPDRPLLNDVKYFRATRGSTSLEYSESYSCEVIKTLDFLQEGIKESGIPKPIRRDTYRGIPKNKKDVIIKKLLPLMPKSRHQFWLNLMENNVPDLFTDYDNE